MDFRQAGFLRRKEYLVLSILGAVEFFIALLLTAILPSESGTTFLLGFSKGRLFLLSAAFGLMLAFLLSAILAFKKWPMLQRFLEVRPAYLKGYLYILPIILLVPGWIAFNYPELVGKYWPYLERILPIGIACGLVFFQVGALILFRRYGFGYFSALFKQVGSKSAIVWTIFIPGLALLTVFYLTGFGIIEKTNLWNASGVPFSSAQLLGLAGCMIFLQILMIRIPSLARFFESGKFLFFLPIFIYFAAVLVWGFTPLDRHFFSLRPTAPNYQPFPFSDALLHDLGGLSILSGDGILFGLFTDKPLYMVLLAFLHLFTGGDYVALQWAQVFVLGFIPVVAYFFAKKFRSPLFGVFLAGLIILQQRNSILLSIRISSANVKILATEGATLLGVVCVVALFFALAQTRNKWVAFLLGGVIGAISLIRLNPLVFFPSIAGLILWFFWKSRQQMISLLVLFVCGFLLVFSPWLITGRDYLGHPWVLSKFNDVIISRIQPIFANPASKPAESAPQNQLADPSQEESQNQDMAAQPESSSAGKGAFDFGILYGKHVLHNVLTSFFALPDSLMSESLLAICQRDSWRNDVTWQPNLPLRHVVLIIGNLFLVSLGLAWSWRKYRWAGLIPVISFLIYDLSLGFSMASGGRYIVPINWIMFFYFGLGILIVWDFLLPALKIGQTVDQLQRPQRPNVQVPALPVVAVMVLLALSIPFANLVVPKIVDLRPVQSVDEVMLASGITPKTGLTYQLGIILYPYYADDSLVFYFHPRRSRFTVYGVPFKLSGEVLFWPESGSDAVLALNDQQEIQALYLKQAGKFQEYWHSEK